MRFEFDPAKEQANIRKHGLDFSAAGAVFADPLGLSVYDRNQDGEDRYRRFGAIGPNFGSSSWFMRSRPEDEELVRIISMRAATRLERKDYEEANE